MSQPPSFAAGTSSSVTLLLLLLLLSLLLRPPRQWVAVPCCVRQAPAQWPHSPWAGAARALQSQRRMRTATRAAAQATAWVQ